MDGLKNNVLKVGDENSLLAKKKDSINVKF